LGSEVTRLNPRETEASAAMRRRRRALLMR
jgi:hypothetical protein